MRILHVVFLALLICGCQTRGDFGHTLVQQVADYGGHTRTSAAIPELHCALRVESTDSEGFQVHLSGIRFVDFKEFMQQVYGDPMSTSVGDGHGGRHDWGTPGHIYYRAADIGVAIEYFGESDGIGFICHRGHAYHLL